MPKACVAINCTNQTRDGISLHEFPKDSHTANLWSQFICTKRKGWKRTKYSHICSDHFEKECFENYTQWEMKLSKKLLLKPDAVPTIHKSKDGKNDKRKNDNEMPPSIRKRQVNLVCILSSHKTCFYSAIQFVL